MSYLGGHTNWGLSEEEYAEECEKAKKAGEALALEIRRKMNKEKRKAKRKLKKDPQYFEKLFATKETK